MLVLVSVMATLVFTAIDVFGSLALLAAVIMAVAGIGNVLSGVLKADDDFSPVLKFKKRAEAVELL